MLEKNISGIRAADLARLIKLLGVSITLGHRDGRYICAVSQWGQAIGVASTDDMCETIDLALSGPMSQMSGGVSW